MNAILNHRSIRKYKSDAINDKILKDILLGASRASNTGNMQWYSIIVTQKPEIKEQLLPLHFNQAMVKEAPLVLTFCADVHRFTLWCQIRKAIPGYSNFLSFFNAATDALLAAQNASLVAESHGLGICYLGTTIYNAGKIIDVLKLPRGVIPVTTLVIGHPAEKPEITDRLPMEAVVHLETYQPYSPELIDTLYNEKENMPFYKDLVAQNNTETLAHIFTDKRYKLLDNENFSKAFLQALIQQGFLPDNFSNV